VNLGKDWEIPLELSGSRKSDVVVETAVLNFGFVPWEQSKQVTASLSHKVLNGQFRIKEIRNAPPTLKADLKQVSPGHYILAAAWTARDSEAVGKVKKMTLTLATNDPEQPLIIIPLLGMTPKTSTGCCGKIVKD